MTPCFSPSSTKDWLRCPVLWHLKKQWAPRVVGKPALARMLGGAVGAGVAAYYGAKLGIISSGPAHLAEITGMAERDRLVACGHTITDAERPFADALPMIARKGVEKYVANDPTPAHWEVVAVEEPLPNHGNCRPDFVFRTPQGLVVPDLKTKRTLDSKWESSTVEEYLASGQFKHYGWAAAEHYGEPVSQVGVILAVLEPRFRVRMELTPLDSEHMQMWLSGRQRVWRQMAAEVAGEAQPWMADECRDRYGWCEYRKACWECRWDEGLMARDYIKKGA